MYFIFNESEFLFFTSAKLLKNNTFINYSKYYYVNFIKEFGYKAFIFVQILAAFNPKTKVLTEFFCVTSVIEAAVKNACASGSYAGALAFITLLPLEIPIPNFKNLILLNYKKGCAINLTCPLTKTTFL